MEFEVQGLCYNHHARRETALLKYLLGIRILGHILLSMPRICLLQSFGLLFTPFSQIFRKNLTEDLGNKISKINGERQTKSFLFQSIGIAIQQGNASCVMGTTGSMRKLEELNYL